MTPFQSARQTFYDALNAHGFALLKLHKVDSSGVCKCRDGSNCRTPGKHFATRHGWQSLTTDMMEIDEHMEDGGAFGLALWFKTPRIPSPPVRLLVFDCDDPEGVPWLESQGITSPLIVTGRRGAHVYCRLPDDVPDLKSDTRTLQSPRIDIKTSGLVVLPWSPNKRLWLHGNDASEDSTAVRKFFGDFAGMLSALPEVDPRVLVPELSLRFPAPIITPHEPATTKAEVPAPVTNRRIKLSHARPEKFFEGYSSLPYNRRKSNASLHAQKVKPSKGGTTAQNCLLLVVANCVLHYGMSDHDTWEIVRDCFNPRCTDRAGKAYPWRKGDVAWAIEQAHRPDAYSTLDRIRKPFDASSVIAREVRRGELANARRLKAQRGIRADAYAALREFLNDFCEEDEGVSVEFSTLLAAVNRVPRAEGVEPISSQRLGRFLTAENIPSNRGTIHGLTLRAGGSPRG